MLTRYIYYTTEYVNGRGLNPPPVSMALIQLDI